MPAPSRTRPLPAVPGLAPETVRALLDVFRQHATEQHRLSQPDAQFGARSDALVSAAAGQTLRLTPGASGMRVALPAPSAQNIGESNAITLLVESPRGPLDVHAVARPLPNRTVVQSKVNGFSSVRFERAGVIRFYSNGIDSWFTQGEVAMPRDADGATLVKEDEEAFPVGAAFLLQTQDLSLPNARVTVNSTELTFDYSNSGLVSLVINEGSVVLTKLEPIADDTVLVNISGSSASPSAVALANFAGEQLTYNTSTHAFDWDGVLVRNDSGANLTARRRLHFVSNVGVGLIALDSAGNAETQIGAYIPTGTHGDIEVSGTGGSVWTVRDGVLDVLNFSPINADSFIANPTGDEATPQEYAFSDFAGRGITYDSGQLHVIAPWALLGRFSVSYTFSTTTTNSDPGNGNLRLDNSTQSSATTIRADEQSAQGDNVITTLEQLAFYQATGSKAVVALVATADVSRFLIFEITGATDVGGYWNIACSVIHASSTNPFSNGESIRMTVTPLAPGSDRLSTAVEISTGSSAADIGVGPGFGRLTFGQGAGFIDSPSNERICQIERDITGDTTCTYRWAFVSINSGFVLANPEGSSHAPYPCSLDTLFDQVFGSSANTAIANVAGTWSGVTLNTNQLLGRVGTGNVGGVSVGAVVNSHVSSTVGYVRNNGDGTLSAFGAASQAQQEAGTSTTAPVTPSVQHFHPSAAKAWARVLGADGSLQEGYNIDSTSLISTGRVGVAWDLSADGAGAGAVSVCVHNNNNSANRYLFRERTRSTTAAEGLCWNYNSGTDDWDAADPSSWAFFLFTTSTS